jgi:hypothetical protein
MYGFGGRHLLSPYIISYRAYSCVLMKCMQLNCEIGSTHVRRLLPTLEISRLFVKPILNKFDATKIRRLPQA